MRKLNGFKGERAVFLPLTRVERLRTTPLTQHLYLLDIGYYPEAEGHYCARPKGAAYHILIYCVAGSGWIKWDEGYFPIHENEFVIIPAHKAHIYGAAYQDPWSIHWFHFHGQLSDQFVSDSASPQRISHEPAKSKAQRIRLFNDMYHNLFESAAPENLSYVSTCLWHLMGSFAHQKQFSTLDRLSQTDRIEKSIRFMQDHLSSKPKLAEMAEVAGLSIPHFSACFKEKTGRSPMRFFQHLKIQQACQLIEHGHLKIKAIAAEVGFDDPYYFSRLFKQMMGETPSAYKRRMGK